MLVGWQHIYVSVSNEHIYDVYYIQEQNISYTESDQQLYTNDHCKSVNV